MRKEEGKGMIFFLIFYFHCGVVRDRGSRVFFFIVEWLGGLGFFFLIC
jgi:hypothetical protein